MLRNVKILLDFVKISSVIGLENEAAGELSAIAVELANLENLTAHASAARARMVEQ